MNDKGQVVYERKLEKGPGSENYGVEVAKHLLRIPSVIDTACEVRKSLNGETFRRSRYNKNKLMKQCEHCGNTHNLHTHHIIFQKTEKNNKTDNLMVLCESCHTKIHSENLSLSTYETVTGTFAVFE